MIVLLILAVVCVILYVSFRSKRKALYELSLPELGTLPLIGHMHWFIGGPEKMLRNIGALTTMIEDAGGIGKVWIGPQLYLVIVNPEEAQIVLENCLQKDHSYRFLRAWLGNGLFVAPVEIWKSHRRVLLPIFHSRIVDDNIEVFGEQAQVLVSLLEEKVGQKQFDIFKFITSCTLDIVFEISMGERMDVQHEPDTPYLRARNTVMSIINMRLFKAWMQPEWLFKLTPYAKIQQDSINTTHDFADKVIKKKKEAFQNKHPSEIEGRRDILERLLDKDVNFTDEQLREHIDSITIAGNDTTALVIAYTLVVLGHHPDAQEKVYTELHTIFGDSKRIPTKEDLNKMEFLERVIKETMRLYTVVPVIGRQTLTELKLSKCTVPAGVGCAIMPYWMHRSKKIWGPDVNEFNPDRFLPENSANRHPCAFIPFSFGTRNCIGRHFGMYVMKSILSNVLRSYRIKSDPCEELKIEILLFPVKGHQICIEKR